LEKATDIFKVSIFYKVLSSTPRTVRESNTQSCREWD
jgi:hypothetical protein